MKNKITDLRNHLFAQMEKLSEANPEELANELERSKAMADLGQVIINSAKAQSDFVKAGGVLKTEANFFEEGTVKQLNGANTVLAARFNGC